MHLLRLSVGVEGQVASPLLLLLHARGIFPTLHVDLGYCNASVSESFPLRIESITLIKPAIPAAASKWPMFVFTVPSRSG